MPRRAASCPTTLGGLPVVCCSLHSQVAPVCAGLGRAARVAYVQLAGGALPVALSDTVRALRARGLLDATVAVGACFDGDVQCVTVASALPGRGGGVRRGRLRDRAGDRRHGLDARPRRARGRRGGARRHARSAATPILAVRASEGDARERHRGVSHHTRAVCELCLGDVTSPGRTGFDAPDGSSRSSESMSAAGGRRAPACRSRTWAAGRDDDPLFFAAAFAAGRAARGRLG